MPRKIFVLILAVFSLSASAQDSSFLSKAINSLNAQPAQERVYLHLDRTIYGFRDTIWYKAYTVIGQKHQPSALSGVLYVELISPADSVVTRQSIPLVSGIGWSDIPLPVTLKPGSYRVRAYTRWMQNFGPGALDEQKVVIGGVAPAVVKAPEKIDVQFFPEGGELVAGVRSRVAFKAVGFNGLGKDIKGTIEDSSGNVVADFAAQHLGMGEFALVPEAGKSYHARINIAGETAFTVDLPKASPSGYTLSVNNSEKDSIYVKISVNDKTLTTDKDKTFYVIAQSNGKVYYTTQGKLEQTTYIAAIEKNRFPEGITQFTLFDQSGEPLAERIAFIENKADEISLTLNTNSQTFNTRDQVELNLAAKDSAGRPVTGSFSVSVINETNVNPDENSESTILNNLLLTSELKGYIEQPNYYFTNQSDKTRTDLDLLMLTQGYRRYEWKEILTQPFTSTAIQQYPPERTQELTGTITKPGGQAIPHGKVTLLATKQNLVRDTTADENGRFIFADLNITDTATLVVRARKSNNGSNVKIKAFVPDYPQIMPAKYVDGETVPIDTVQQLSSKAQYNQYRQEQKNDSLKNGKMLKTVTIRGIKHPEQPDFSRSSNLHGGGNADRVIMGKDLGNCINLSDCLTSKLIGISFQGMSVIVNGVNLGEKHINDVNPNEIYSIEVLYSGFAKSIYGSSIAKEGALIITLKNGSESASTDTIKTAGQLHYAQYEQQQKEYLEKNGKLLKTVTIKGIKHPPQPKLLFSSNLNGPGHANQVIMWNQLGDGCIDLSDCLNGKLAGVTIQSGKAFSARAQSHLSGPIPMTVIIDGVILEASHLNDVSPTEIYSIEVLRSGAYLAIYGSNAPGGAIIITTKRGGEGTAYFSQAQPNGIMTFPFAGFYKAKAFYTPKYGSPKKASDAPDTSSTVYWNPNILTNKDGKATLEFYNNDSKGTYRVVVEGIDDDGRLGRQVYLYSVSSGKSSFGH
ncbi:MAG: TonB-dependent receptor plug domain-containing protein [Bacteroidetes bacterium]|nr:TonB-dependent receptor plug domain-containing protein [Bacteroidota bacterium]